MKLVLIVQVPDNDKPYWERVNFALRAYANECESNNAEMGKGKTDVGMVAHTYSKYEEVEVCARVVE